MSAFFEPPPPPPDEPQHSPAPWFAPPAGTLPGVAALELVLAHTDRVAIYIARLLGYPTGFGFDVMVIAAPAGQDEQLDMGAALFGHHRRGHHRQLDPLDPERLRLGVQFSDGQKATNIGTFDDTEDQPSGPVMHAVGGSGSDREYHQEQWVWPLPPPGRLSFVCEWPAAGIELTRHEIDAQDVLDAAGRAQTLFPDPSPGRGGAPPSVVSYGLSQVATSKPKRPDSSA